ncbi:hypothetical protein GCM10012275_28420 [Longimycelium tulufanense]|uniref:Uncharacterized protein n=1 Tax=Longimycelium tulufanense TaxID=907463 RepID=A0A8J3CE78_9PSEU|nr:hypothetical protein GCM10012275_28420 [Longimycelium tulufanense]
MYLSAEQLREHVERLGLREAIVRIPPHWIDSGCFKSDSLRAYWADARCRLLLERPMFQTDEEQIVYLLRLSNKGNDLQHSGDSNSTAHFSA